MTSGLSTDWGHKSLSSLWDKKMGGEANKHRKAALGLCDINFNPRKCFHLDFQTAQKGIRGIVYVEGNSKRHNPMGIHFCCPSVSLASFAPLTVPWSAAQG